MPDGEQEQKIMFISICLIFLSMPLGMREIPYESINFVMAFELWHRMCVLTGVGR